VLLPCRQTSTGDGSDFFAFLRQNRAMSAEHFGSFPPPPAADMPAPVVSYGLAGRAGCMPPSGGAAGCSKRARRSWWQR
jgi:hypothetical protein